jgi:hypothetical protein
VEETLIPGMPQGMPGSDMNKIRKQTTKKNNYGIG